MPGRTRLLAAWLGIAFVAAPIALVMVFWRAPGTLVLAPSRGCAYFLRLHRGEIRLVRQRAEPEISADVIADVSQLGELRVIRRAEPNSGGRDSPLAGVHSDTSVAPGYVGLGSVDQANQITILLSDGQTATFTMSVRGFGLPVWIVSAGPIIAVGIMLRRRFRAKARVLSGRCVKCGYDLRATPQRCPECGTMAHLMHRRKSMQIP